MTTVATPAKLSFGFGLSPYSRFADIADLVDTVVLAEELGYGVVGLPEHLLPGRSGMPAWASVWYDQAVLGAFIAARTHRIAIMPGVQVVPYHPPVQAAKALATLDIVSGGRLRLGVGVGWDAAEFERLGVSFEERGAITDEYLDAMRELWTSPDPAYDGKYVSFADVSFQPRPTKIPVYIGGSVDRSFRRVAERGDGWYPMTDDPAMIRVGVERIRELRERSGRPDQPITVVCALVVADDPQLAALRRHVRSDLEQGWAEADAAPRASSEACVDKARALAAAGADVAMVKFAWTDGAQLRDELRWFASSVMPELS